MAEEVIGLLFGVDGGGAIDGRSGQQIVRDLTQIVNQINSGKSTVPKVQLKFDTSHAKTALQELKTQLQEIAGMGNISVSGMSSRGGSGGSAGVKQDAENYRALTTTVKQYYAALAEVEKIQMKSTAVSSSGGVWSTTDAQYDARIQKINQLKMEFDRLGISVNQSGMVEMNSAQMLNITEEQRAMLLAQVQSAITANGLAHEKSAAQISATWDKNAAKVHEYILRMREVASQNAEVAAMMNQLDSLATSGNPRNLDQLTTGFANLQQKVRETGADVQTFGQKLSKTFGSQLRYMLTSMVYMRALQFIRDLYNNVVELDKALTDLQIASGKTKDEIRELAKGYAQLAQQIGATTLEVAKSADTWLRQGYEAAEANTLITNSMMLSKLGQIEAAEAAKNLTSAMKGYKVSVNDSIGIVDKFTAVDMVAAASAGDMATAMAETATSADIAGVSMNRLIGYLAVVKEVTQDGAESVGTFYKTLFARMNNVKAGKFIDPETGESLNDVEKVLTSLGISLRDANGLFRESGDVLDEVAARWESFDNVSQHAIATAFAGTRQQEKFIVLMENYGTALEYAETAANSAGTAMEKYAAYTESIEGKMNSLKATFEEFSTTILNSDWLAGGIDLIRGLLSVLNGILSFGDSFLVKAALIIATIYLAIAAYGKLKGVFVAAKANISELIALQTALAGSQAVGVTTTSALTAALVKYSSTGLLGVITTIPRAIAAVVMWIASNIKAKVATDASTASAIGFKAAMDAMNVNPFILAITAAIAVCASLVAILKSVDTAWEETYQKAKDAANAQQELVDKYDSEIDALESLQEKLVDAQGNRQKLSSLYSELNGKVAVSTGLLQGEESAYKAVNAQIQDQINAMRALREEALGARIANERSAFDAQKGKRYGGIWNWDWTKSDTSGSTMRELMSGDTSAWTDEIYAQMILGIMNNSNGIDPDEVGKYLNYEVFYEKLTQGEQEMILKSMGFTAESWQTYWDGQVATAKSVFEDTINDSSGIFGNTFMESVVDRLVRGGHDLDSVANVLNDLSAGSYALNEQISEYYEALEKGSPNADTLYNNLMLTFDGYIEKYPELTKIFATLIASIRDTNSAQEELNVTLHTLSSMLQETEGAYDAIISAMDDMATVGALTSDTIQTITDEFPALLKYLEETAEGFTLADNAMSQFLGDVRAHYLDTIAKAQEAYDLARINYENSEDKTVESYKAVMEAQQELQYAIDNANTWLRTEAVLTRSNLIEEYTELLKSQSDALDEQYDAYKDLCDLRKDLLKSYQEELDYQKELSKIQGTVSKLSTQLATSKLDTSEAGKARTRKLEQELKDAQDKLDDITLEHAIDILETQIESQLMQYENFIDRKVIELENTITNAANMTSAEIAQAITALGGNGADKLPADTGTTSSGSTVNTDNSSYNSAVNNAQNHLNNNSTVSQPKPLTEAEKIAAQIVKFGDASGSGMNAGKTGDNGIIKWNGKEYEVENKGSQDSSTNLYKAAVNELQFQDRQIFGYGGNVYGYLDGHIQKLGGRYWSQKGFNSFVDDVKAHYGTYHTGGFVGDISALASNEEFAKLLKGEFVSTPAQMKRFMEETLPRIANYTATGGTNEFNAPLIEILCESVTSESLPELKRIVEEAVKELQKQLDSGMSRTGFKRTPTKRLT